MINPKDYIFDEKYIIFKPIINDSKAIDEYYYSVFLGISDEDDINDFRDVYSRLRPNYKYTIDDIGDWTNSLNCYLDIESGPMVTENGTRSIPIQRIIDREYSGYSRVVVGIEMFCYKGYTDLRDTKILNIIQ